MFIRDYMTRHPVMIAPTASIVEAQGIMAETHVRHLPVVETGKRLVGLVTQESLRVPPTRLTSLNVWEITRFLSDLTVSDVMVKGKDVITIELGCTIEDGARIMVERKIGRLPVLEDGIVMGIITDADIMAHLMEMMAAQLPGIRATVRMAHHRAGELAKLVSAVAAQGWAIAALGGAPSPRDPDKWWDAVIKLQGLPKEEVAEVLGRIPDQEVIDIREV